MCIKVQYLIRSRRNDTAICGGTRMHINSNRRKTKHFRYFIVILFSVWTLRVVRRTHKYFRGFVFFFLPPIHAQNHKQLLIFSPFYGKSPNTRGTHETFEPKCFSKIYIHTTRTRCTKNGRIKNTCTYKVWTRLLRVRVSLEFPHCVKIWVHDGSLRAEREREREKSRRHRGDRRVWVIIMTVDRSRTPSCTKTGIVISVAGRKPQNV